MLTLCAPAFERLQDPCAIFQALTRVPQCMNEADNLMRLRLIYKIEN